MEIYWKNEKTKELFKSEKKLQKKGLDKKAAKFYSIREHIKYAKKEFSGKDKVTY